MSSAGWRGWWALLNFDQLSPLAQAAVRDAGLEPVYRNPFQDSIVRNVEGITFEPGMGLSTAVAEKVQEIIGRVRQDLDVH